MPGYSSVETRTFYSRKQKQQITWLLSISCILWYPPWYGRCWCFSVGWERFFFLVLSCLWSALSFTTLAQNISTFCVLNSNSNVSYIYGQSGTWYIWYTTRGTIRYPRYDIAWCQAAHKKSIVLTLFFFPPNHFGRQNCRAPISYPPPLPPPPPHLPARTLSIIVIIRSFGDVGG